MCPRFEVGVVEKRWIWPFELLDKLGEGGMGVVYRARYVVDNRHVAVKLLPANIANETILSRFERELEILKTLRHPNIVRCFGGVCEGNQHFYAMELVEGGTLDRLLEERGRFSWDVTIQFALQMASGLSYAHERGVVHRDVKPGNFLLTQTGKLKLSDFGLATVEAASKITAAGKTMGTFPYMAPEQIRGRPPVSPQTDLYALGCVIFEMLTGRTPFVGDTPAEVMHKHLDQPPPNIAEFAPDCPIGLQALVRDLLQKDPNDRPESAYVVAQRLTDFSNDLRGVPQKSRSVGELPAAAATEPPRGVLDAARTVLGSPAAGGAARRWHVPILALLLVISVCWNVASLFSVRRDNRALDLWVQAAGNDQVAIREEAHKALGDIGRTNPAAIAALSAALADPRPAVRSTAIDALRGAAAGARPALPQLMHVQQHDENDLIRAKAGEAVREIQHSPDASASRFALWPWILAIVFLAGIAVVFFTLRDKRPAPRSSR